MYFGLRVVKIIDIGVAGEKVVAVEQCGKELTASFGNTIGVVFEVVPGCRVAYHVPAQRVAAVLVDSAEGIDGIAEALRHFVAEFVKHQTIGNHGLV